jgi:DnaK suppressor protein
LHEEFILLREVRAALNRVEEGTYGICQQFEDDISSKRLNAVPWVPYCILCQEATDRHEETGHQKLDGLLVSVS